MTTKKDNIFGDADILDGVVSDTNAVITETPEWLTDAEFNPAVITESLESIESITDVEFNSEVITGTKLPFANSVYWISGKEPEWFTDAEFNPEVITESPEWIAPEWITDGEYYPEVIFESPEWITDGESFGVIPREWLKDYQGDPIPEMITCEWITDGEFNAVMSYDIPYEWFTDAEFNPELITESPEWIAPEVITCGWFPELITESPEWITPEVSICEYYPEVITENLLINTANGALFDGEQSYTKEGIPVLETNIPMPLVASDFVLA